MPNAPRDDDVDLVLAKPAREQARLMIRGGEEFAAHRPLGWGVDFDQRELTTAAEVSMHSSGFCRNGNSHGLGRFGDQRVTTVGGIGNQSFDQVVCGHGFSWDEGFEAGDGACTRSQHPGMRKSFLPSRC